MSYKDILNSKVQGIQWNWTAASPGQEALLRQLVGEVSPRRILEIGTYQGVATAFLASLAGVERVATVDILPDPKRAHVWDAMQVRKKIEEFVCRTSQHRDMTILQYAADSDLVFVDGCHLMPDVMRDFYLASSCDSVLMHDYGPGDWPDVTTFVDDLSREEWDVHTYDQFALCRRRYRGS